MIWFVDSAAAVDALIKGSAKSGDLTVAIQLVHLLFARLEIRICFEWVHSKGNCSDGVSRLGERDPFAKARGWKYEAMAEPNWSAFVDTPLETLADLFIPR